MKKPFILALPAVITALCTLPACESTTGDIGSSLIQEESEVVIHNQFVLTGHTEPNTNIESRTIVQLLGDIHAKGYGNFSSDFVCQFMPSMTLDTAGVTADHIDSLKLSLSYPNGAYVGDSIAPMGLEVFALNKQLPTPIYSNLNPADYCDLSAGPIGSRIYVGNALGANDSIQGLSYREITVDLPVQMARDLFNLYKLNPQAYASPQAFVRHFPGIYVRNSFGAGRVTQIQRTTLMLYYHTDSKDADGNPTVVKHVTEPFAVTPEIVNNNNIRFTIDPELQARIDAGENILVTPVGRDVILNFPVNDVIDYYQQNRGPLSVINSLTMKIPAELLDNDYDITPPQSLLLVLSSKKDEFFLNNSINDNKTSFIATYSESDKSYSFTGLRDYFLSMLDKYNADGRIDPADATFTLTPVAVTYENSQSSYYYSGTTYISSITPYIGKPRMVKLLLDKADITFQFAKQTFH